MLRFDEPWENGVIYIRDENEDEETFYRRIAEFNEMKYKEEEGEDKDETETV